MVLEGENVYLLNPSVHEYLDNINYFPSIEICFNICLIESQCESELQSA